MKKDEPSGRNAFKKAFEDYKRTGLFSGLTELHEKYGELSEAGSHPTMESFVNRMSIEDRDGQRHMILNYCGAPDQCLFAMELFSRLLTCFVMERTFFEDYETRFQLGPRLMQTRGDFEIFKENLRLTLIAGYKIHPPPPKQPHP